MTRGRPRGTALTRDDVVDAALEVATRDGADALTMRRLAAELGITAGSLYHHVASREALLDLLADRLRTLVTVPDPMPPRWQDAMEEIYVRYTLALAEHPALVAIAGRRVASDPDGLADLIGRGIDRDAAVQLWQSVLAFSLGFAQATAQAVVFDQGGPDGAVAARFAHWEEATLRRSLRALIEAYAP